MNSRSLTGALLIALATLAGCGSTACLENEQRCNYTCVNLQSNPDHCGGCGQICGPTQVCSLGGCGDSCATGLDVCSRACVDLRNDPRNCGVCGKDCGSNATCQLGSCVDKPDAGRDASDAGPDQCTSRVTFSTNGVYDVPLSVVAVSGRVTRNGATVGDSTSSSRGTIVFVSTSGSGDRRMASLGSSGEATYQGELFGGTYDVFYEPYSSCSEGGPLPCHKTKLKSKIALTTNGTLDLDLKVIAVSGRVTRNGQPLGSSTSSSRGTVVFTYSSTADGGARTMPALGSSGEATYQGELFAGTYNVSYQPYSSCSEGGPLPCQRTTIKTKLPLTTSGTLDLDLKVVAVSGRVTRNGQTVGDSTSSSRGSITFTYASATEGGARTMPALGSSGEATYQGEIFAGTYDVSYQPYSSCSEGGPLPCHKTTVKSKLALTTSGTLDLDLKVIAVSGRVTRNGQPVGSSTSSSRGTVVFTYSSTADGGARTMPSLGSSGEATYQGELFAGTYNVSYQPYSSCSEGGPLPCQRTTVKTKLPLTTSGTLDLDLKVVAVSGRVTRNGQTVGDSTSSSRGTITFTYASATEGGARTMPALGSSGEATYQGELFSGTYDASFQPYSSCSEGGPLPCQRTTVKTKLPLTTNGTLDLDLKVITISGRVTRNGQVVGDSTSSSRGTITFALAGGGNRAMPSLGSTGEATYQGELFAGQYDVSYQPYSSCSEGGPLPCQRFLVAGCAASALPNP